MENINAPGNQYIMISFLCNIFMVKRDLREIDGSVVDLDQVKTVCEFVKRKGAGSSSTVNQDFFFFKFTYLLASFLTIFSSFLLSAA